MPTRQDIEELYLPTGRVITEEWYSKLTEVLHEFKDEIDGITPVISYGYVRGDVLPDLDLALNLGLKTLRFKEVWAGWGYFTYHLQTGNLLAESSSKIILEKRTDDVVEEGRIFYRTDTQEVKVGTGTQAILAGARKLSQLIIDTNKDWGGYGISNLSYLDSSSFRLAGTEFLGSDRFLKAVKIARYYNEGELDYVRNTTESLLFRIAPDTPHEYFLTLLSMRIDIDNPTGSGATLYWRMVARLDDDSEKTILSSSASEGVARTYYMDEHDIIYPDGTRSRLWWNIPSGRAIKEFRFYGYVSATPPFGYEPSVWARWINAIQV